MDKGNNKFNKVRNKFNPNQNNPLNFPHNKNIKRNYPIMPYDPNQNPGLIPNEEFLPSAPYPMQGIYPMQMPIPQNKENFLKNAFKAYYLNQKKKALVKIMNLVMIFFKDFLKKNNKKQELLFIKLKKKNINLNNKIFF